MNKKKKIKTINQLARKYANGYFIFIEDDEKFLDVPASLSIKYKTEFDSSWLQCEQFEAIDKGYMIKLEGTWYFIDLIEFPSDRFGNVATIESGIKLHDECQVVYYEDNDTKWFSRNFPYSDYIYENNLKRLFHNWFILEKNFSNYNFIAEIVEEGITAIKVKPVTEKDKNGSRLMEVEPTYQNWGYITTNADFESLQWRSLFDHFELDFKASNWEGKLENCNQNDFPYLDVDESDPLEFSHITFCWEYAEKENEYEREVTVEEMVKAAQLMMNPHPLGFSSEVIEEKLNSEEISNFLEKAAENLAEYIDPEMLAKDYQPFSIFKDSNFIPKCLADAMGIERGISSTISLDENLNLSIKHSWEDDSD